MKKTNVMIEVSDEIYETVVSPYKKSKSFGKLVVHLLEAYYENDSIYGYINGTMDNIESEATKELLNDLNDMAQSLSMIGMLGSQAESVIDNGHKEFSKFGDKAKKEYEHNEYVQTEKGNPVTMDDVINIVNNAVSSSMSDIKEMLREALNSRGTVSNNTVEEEPNNFDSIEFSEGTNEDKFVSDEEEYFVPDEEEEGKARDALSSLLNSISF